MARAKAADLIPGVRSFWREHVMFLGCCYPPAPRLFGRKVIAVAVNYRSGS